MSIDDREKIYKFRGIGWTRSGLRQSGRQNMPNGHKAVFVSHAQIT